MVSTFEHHIATFEVIVRTFGLGTTFCGHRYVINKPTEIELFGLLWHLKCFADGRLGTSVLRATTKGL